MEFSESIAKQGVDIERDLVRAARTPRPTRANALAEPIAAVTRLEATVAELTKTSAQWKQTMNGPAQSDSQAEMKQRLAAFRQASDEVNLLTSHPTLPVESPTNPVDERPLQMEG
jgi:hypothetical protein